MNQELNLPKTEDLIDFGTRHQAQTEDAITQQLQVELLLERIHETLIGHFWIGDQKIEVETELSKEQIAKIMQLFRMNIHKGIFLSNFTKKEAEKAITSVMISFINDLTNTNTPITIRDQIIDSIDNNITAAYNRAIDGKERQTAREAQQSISITQMRDGGIGGEQIDRSVTGTLRRFFGGR